MEKTFTKENSYTAKGLAILLLLAYHLFENQALIEAMEVNYSPLPLPVFLMLTGFGNICVSVFVFLTSYGIAAGLLAQPDITPAAAGKQAVKRFVILMIRFALLFISVNLLWWNRFDYQSLYGINKQGFLYFLTDASGLSMFFNTPTLNETWWYMELAYLLIFLVPLLTGIVKKIGYPVLFLGFFLPHLLSFNPDVTRYFFVAVFGVCAAYGKWPEKLLNLKIHPVLRWLIGIAGILVCIPVRQNYVVYNTYVSLVDAPIALFLVWFAAALIGTVPVLGKIFTFIGKHSMNIYLVHTFFYLSLWQKYIYRFKYAWASFLLLLAVSLIYSVLLELIKKVTGIKKLLARYHG